MGWRNWFEAERPDFDKTDEDSNGRLSEDELHEVVNAADLMGGWQGADDGYLTPQEFEVHSISKCDMPMISMGSPWRFWNVPTLFAAESD